MKKITFVALVGLLLVGCTAGPNELVGVVPRDGSLAGFWWGLWHGIISPITFFISLFTDSVNIYEVRNSGNWYDFGFILGAGILFRGGSKSVSKSKKSKEKRNDDTFMSL